MGLMWSDQANNSGGGKREKIDAARIHMAQQALAAIMNDSTCAQPLAVRPVMLPACSP